MKAVSCNQRNGGHRKALCPGAPQGPVWYHPPPNSSGLEFPPPGHPCSDLPRSLNTGNPHQRWENAMPFFFFFKYIYLFYFWLHWVFVAVRIFSSFSSRGERGLLFVAVRGLLTVGASLVVEHGL